MELKDKDIVMITKPLIDMESYNCKAGAIKELQVGSIGYSLGESGSVDALIVFEPINATSKDSGDIAWFCSLGCLTKITSENKNLIIGKKAIINNLKNRFDKSEMSGAYTIANYNVYLDNSGEEELRVGDTVRIIDINIEAQRDFNNDGKYIVMVRVEPIEIKQRSNVSAYWINAQYIDVLLDDKPTSKTTSIPKEEEIPTPIKALKKATKFSIGETIQFIPDDDTVAYVGIIEAYVVTKKQIFLQTTNGDLVLPGKVVKKGEIK